VGGVTWYVRASGDDNAVGNRVSHALRTIGEATLRAGPGDRIVVGPGLYDESVDNVPTGRDGRPLVFFADVTGEITADPPGPVEVGTRNSLAAFRMTSVDFVVIDGFTVSGGSEGGISVRTGSGNVTIRNCIIHDNGTGILILSSDDVLVFNNLIVNNDRIGIDARGAGRLDNIRLINNTIAGNGDLGIQIGERVTEVQTLMQNNIVQDNPQGNLQSNDASVDKIELRYNLVSPDSYSPASLPHDTDVNEDARFAGGGDYHLGGTSPALDAGDPDTDSTLAAALHERSTTSNGAADTGQVDLGYHFPP
jgi:parallel beta-helix repeat protein